MNSSTRKEGMPSYFERIDMDSPGIITFRLRKEVKGRMIQNARSVRLVRQEPDGELMAYQGTQRVPLGDLQPSLRDFCDIFASYSEIKEVRVRHAPSEPATVQFHMFDTQLRVTERELEAKCNHSYLRRNRYDGERRPVLLKTGCQLVTS